MRLALAAVALAASPAVLADATQPVQAVASSVAAVSQERGYHERLYQRYCDKLREGPEAYAAFVRRMYTVTGYTYTEFAPQEPTDIVRYQCREASGAFAAREQRGG